MIWNSRSARLIENSLVSQLLSNADRMLAAGLFYKGATLKLKGIPHGVLSLTPCPRRFYAALDARTCRLRLCLFRRSPLDGSNSGHQRAHSAGGHPREA